MIRIGRIKEGSLNWHNPKVKRQTEVEAAEFIAEVFEIIMNKAIEIIAELSRSTDNTHASEFLVLPLTNDQLANYAIERQLRGLNTYWKYPHPMSKDELQEVQNEEYRFDYPVDSGKRMPEMGVIWNQHGPVTKHQLLHKTIMEKIQMNNINTKLRNTVSFINEGHTTISATFELNSKIIPAAGKTYTYKVTKDFAATIKAGDYVVVEKAGSLDMPIVRVVEVHEESEIDIDAEYAYGFAFQRVAIEELATLQTEEMAQVKQLQVEQRNHLRNQARANINLQLANVSEDGRVKKL
jgi:hypothetical protein